MVDKKMDVVVDKSGKEKRGRKSGGGTGGFCERESWSKEADRRGMQ